MSHRQNDRYPPKRHYDGRDGRQPHHSGQGGGGDGRRPVSSRQELTGSRHADSLVYAPDKRARVDDDSNSAGPSKPKPASVSFDSSADKPSAHQDDYDADLTFELEDEETERKRIAEQRRKRQELLAKLSSQGAASASASASALQTSTPAQASSSPAASGSTPQPPPAAAARSSPGQDFEMTKAEPSTAVPPPASRHEVSAADYDPSVDRKVDEAREQQQQQRDAAPPATVTTTAGVAQGIGEPVPPPDKNGTETEYEEVEVDEEDDIDDMFSLGAEAGEKPKKKKTIRVKKTKNGVALPDATATDGPAHAGLTSNWDDDEGYYRIVLGERIGPKGRFHVFANLGKGMFSEVVRAKDLGEDGKGSGDSTPDVAVKIVRSQETMYKAGIKEIAHLQKLARLDVDDKRHVVRLVSHFTHRGHLCMVFENLAMNLREVVKRFGKDVGLNLKAVKAYAHQMLLGLALFRKAGIVHADLKPDNVLVNEAKTTLKICDLGSAVDVNEMDLTPYLVSRFYRAPEVILGLPCDASIDAWAVGCTLYELYTGRILFPGRSNNQMLHLIQETKGKVPTKLIRKGQFAHLHFDETNTFLAHAAPTAANSAVAASDGVDGFVAPAKRVVLPTSPVNGQDLKSRLASPQVLRGLDEQEARRTQAFVELLGRMLEVDPAKRITPQEALRHAFLAA